MIKVFKKPIREAAIASNAIVVKNVTLALSFTFVCILT